MKTRSFEGSKYSFRRYIASHRSNKLFFLLSIPFIIFIIILYPIVRLRVGECRSRNIGDFIIPPEIHLNELKLQIKRKKRNEFYLFFFNRVISNEYLANHWRKNLTILPRLIMEPIFYFFFCHSFFRKFLVPLRYGVDEKNKRTFYAMTADPNNTLIKSNISMKFNSEEILFGNNLLASVGFNINQKIVCFANRDGAFKGERKKSKRNAEINTYKSAIEYLANKNIFNIRMGRLNNENINFSQKNIFDYSFSKIKSDFMDMFIFSKCDFAITTGHGINQIAFFFRKKNLLINFEGFNNLHYCNQNFTPLILPKKYKDKNKNKYLHFVEVYKKKLYLMNLEDLNLNGYDLIDNTEEEILDATKEMYMILNNKKEINYDNQKKFWDLHESFFNWKPNSLNISNTFFKNNADLFN
tara:strand:- start:1108 stop:2343 length:1236 start_codon:yes stop_codon:yes gene_type:complete